MAVLSIAASLLIVAVATFQGIQAKPTLPIGCYGEGIQPHPRNCEKFLLCSLGHTLPTVMDCPIGPYGLPLFFNPGLRVCDYRSKVRCGAGNIIIPKVTVPPAPTPPPHPTLPPSPPTRQTACFKAKDNGYGSVTVHRSGYIRSIILVHLSGQVSCYAEKPETYSKWGCSDLFTGKLGVYVTRSNTEILFPDINKVQRDEYNFYELIIGGQKFDENSGMVIFEEDSRRVQVHAGEKLQLWYGEDLLTNLKEEEINAGEVCAGVEIIYY